MSNCSAATRPRPHSPSAEYPKDVGEQVYVTSLAATADLAGADDVRDAALGRFCSAFKTQSPKSAQIFLMIRDALAAKKTAASWT